MRRLASLVVGGLLALVTVVSAADRLTPQLADAFAKKMVAVQQQAADAAVPKKPRTTPFAESELNSYLRFKATDQLPVGLTEPAFTLIGQGRVSASAVIDLDVVREKQSRGGWFDPMSYLSGKLPVTALGVVRTESGKASFELERAEISGVPVPKSLLQQILAFYTKSAERPNGASLDDAYDMPAQIQRLFVEPARVIVIQ